MSVGFGRPPPPQKKHQGGARTEVEIESCKPEPSELSFDPIAESWTGTAPQELVLGTEPATATDLLHWTIALKAQELQTFPRNRSNCTTKREPNLGLPNQEGEPAHRLGLCLCPSVHPLEHAFNYNPADESLVYPARCQQRKCNSSAFWHWSCHAHPDGTLTTLENDDTNDRKSGSKSASSPSDDEGRAYWVHDGDCRARQLTSAVAVRTTFRNIPPSSELRAMFNVSTVT